MISDFQHHRRPTRARSIQERLQSLLDLCKVVQWYGTTKTGVYSIQIHANIYRARSGFLSITGNNQRGVTLSVLNSCHENKLTPQLRNLYTHALDALLSTPITFHGTSGALITTTVKRVQNTLITRHIIPAGTDYTHVLDFERLTIPPVEQLGGAYEKVH